MYALRFFIGLFESCAFPGYIAILGSWYGPQELTKRTAILLEIESIASMFSGYLQAGLYNGLNGKHGLAGWRCKSPWAQPTPRHVIKHDGMAMACVLTNRRAIRVRWNHLDSYSGRWLHPVT